MCVLLVYGFKHLLLRKTDVPKTCRKRKFLEKKTSRNAMALKSKKVQVIFGETLNFEIIIFSCLSSTKVSQISFKFFCSGDKRLSSEFLRK